MSFLYQEHFGLNKPPFQITPDIDYFFSGSHRGDILTALLHVANYEEGIVTVVAEVGSGKTLLARLLLNRLPTSTRSVYLANPSFSREEIITAIARDLGVAASSNSLEEKVALLQQELLQRYAQGERVLLVIDEAHAMPAESLEEVRLLSNLETAQHKLINIMLFGQPELDALLAEPRLRQLLDRVVHRFELLPFSFEEGAAYLEHRLQIAGCHQRKLFSAAAEKLLIQAAGGRARRINLLADKALLAAYSEGLPQVDKPHVQRACQDLHENPVATAQNRQSLRTIFTRPSALGLSLLLALTLGFAMFYSVKTAVSPSLPAPFAQDSSKTQAMPTMPVPIEATKMAEVFARTDTLLKNPNLSGFTLQLFTLPAEDDLQYYFERLLRFITIEQLYARYGTDAGGRYVAIYMGRYVTREDALTALEGLPPLLQADLKAKVKAHSPLIRPWAKIRQEVVIQP